MVSLQEQLLKAGLVDKKKVKQAGHDKTKQKRCSRVARARAPATSPQWRNRRPSAFGGRESVANV